MLVIDLKLENILNNEIRMGFMSIVIILMTYLIIKLKFNWRII
jgi:hypothetical protein